ncbi:MAG TPA: argininosuccinate lyase [Flavobacterium sp.]|nr:argininosuccinate lyase [Flavobacterium sp.]
MKAIWEKKIKVDASVANFTVGLDQEMDMYLAEFDVLGSLAHIKMLESINLITADELKNLSTGLVDIYKDIKAGNFVIEEGVEDVHSQVELLLTRKYGDAGKKIHSGRSRNDQVLLDMKLYLRDEIFQFTELTKVLFDTFLSLSEKHKEIIIPGYTHMQVAMPSSFGLWFGAYAEALIDDMHVLRSAYSVCNQNPLGSAAGYGSSFPLNRTMTTTLLGFDDLAYNVVYAQMGRGKTEKIMAFAMASLASTLAKFSMDACLFMSQNFSFISLPEAFTTGSSIMPHKKNPDVFELVRGKCNRIAALPNDITLITSNLSSGYHRDMQLLKEVLFPAIQDLKNCISILKLMLDNIIVNKNIIHDEKYKYCFSVEEVNNRVLKGVPFRDAYLDVGLEIAAGNFKPNYNIQHTHEGSLGNLCNDMILAKMDHILDAFNFKIVEERLNDLLQ